MIPLPCEHTAYEVSCHFCRLAAQKGDYRALYGLPADWGRELPGLHPGQQPGSDLPPVDVVTLISGRWYSWKPWLESLLALDYPRDRLRLWWYSNSRDVDFLALASTTAINLARDGWLVRFQIDPTLKISRNAHREAQPGEPFAADHCEVIAELYNRAVALTSDDLFFLEDDLAVPGDSLRRLQAACRQRGAGYAVAAVHDRHSPVLFCWDTYRDAAGVLQLKGPSREPGVRDIGVGNLGCAYVPRWAFRALSAPKFKPYAPPEWRPGQVAGCDLVLCQEMDRQGIARLCDFGLWTRHYDSKGIAH